MPVLRRNLDQNPEFIQVVLGPRQVGKSTGVAQLLEASAKPHLYVSADDVTAPTPEWLLEKWQQALTIDPNCLLAIDEVQKISDWSQVVKGLWDRQARKRDRLRLILLGSTSLQIQTGLDESLTGRFQMVKVSHWNYASSRELANMNLQTFVNQGGYPGSYRLLNDERAWSSYIQHSIIDTVIGKDILSFSRVRKPALFRQAFALLTCYPAQEMSYNKLLGQLQDSGNVDLVKHYIELFESAFLVKSIFKYSKRALVQRSSSPKIIPLCGALIDRQLVTTADGYGRALEAAIGAALITNNYEVSYWREGTAEVDYVVEHQGKLLAIEVKSGRHRPTRGMAAFMKLYPEGNAVFINQETVEAFLLNPRDVLDRLVT